MTLAELTKKQYPVFTKALKLYKEKKFDKFLKTLNEYDKLARRYLKN